MHPANDNLVQVNVVAVPEEDDEDDVGLLAHDLLAHGLDDRLPQRKCIHIFTFHHTPSTFRVCRRK